MYANEVKLKNLLVLQVTRLVVVDIVKTCNERLIISVLFFSRFIPSCRLLSSLLFCGVVFGVGEISIETLLRTQFGFLLKCLHLTRLLSPPLPSDYVHGLISCGQEKCEIGIKT